jgi:inosose dehydratase
LKLGYHLAPWVRDNHFENIHRAFDEISLTGWDGVELSGHWLVEQYGSRAGELKALLALHDLEVSSVYFRPTYQRDNRDRDLDLTRRVVDATLEAGGSIVLIDGGEPVPGGATEDDFARVAEVANIVGDQARRAGLTCCWHQHWGTMFEWAAPFDRLMALTDPDLVKFCPDSAQLTMGDFDVEATFRKYADRIGFIHFKDLDVNHNWSTTAAHGGPRTWGDTGGYRVDSKWRFVELGRGIIDFPSLLAIVKAAGYDGWILDDFDYSAYSTREASITLLTYLRHSLGLVGRRGHAGWAG